MTDNQRNLLRQEIEKNVLVWGNNRPIKSKAGGDSDWMFDFRKIALQPSFLETFSSEFWDTYEGQFPFQVGGLETAAIPLVTAVVLEGKRRNKDVTGFFIRKSRKKDGLLSQIEGTLSNRKTILVDDIVNSGNSLKRQVNILENEGVQVTDVFAVLSFENPRATEFLNEAGIRSKHFFTIADFGLKDTDRKQEPLPRKLSAVWRFQSDKPNYFYVVPKSAPILDNERIYFGSDSGNFWALNQSDGSVAWKYRVGFHAKGKSIFSSPALCNATVYFGAYDGNVYALDAKTGKRKWVFMEADWVGSSPALAPDLGLLFIGLEFGLIKKRGGIAALDLETGEKKWEFSMQEYTHSSPLYIPERREVIIGSNDKAVYLFDAKNGKLKWKYQTSGEIKESFAYDPKRGLALFGSLDGRLYAIHAATGELTFSHQTRAGIYSTPLVHGDAVYVASLDKRLYKINLDSGEQEWSFETSGRIFSSPIILEEDIYIGSNDGHLYSINRMTGKGGTVFQATERITNRIAHNNKSGRVFLPTFANEIYCLTEE